MDGSGDDVARGGGVMIGSGSDEGQGWEWGGVELCLGVGMGRGRVGSSSPAFVYRLPHSYHKSQSWFE